MKKILFTLLIALAFVVSGGSPVAAEKPVTQCAAKARTVASGDVVYWLDLFNTIGCEQTLVTNVGGGEYLLQPVHHD